jgi:hypothetical protein
MEMKKTLALGIILLFIGVAVAPSIVVKASNDNDLVEVTTQACGIKGYGNATVKLTREQYQNLEDYLMEFRARLNQTSTREEAVPIFKDAVVELDKYGLLPKGMSVERAQKLVLSMCFNQRIGEFIKRVFGVNQANESSNMFCLVSGKVTHSVSYGVFYPIRLRLSLLGFRFFDFWEFTWLVSELLLILRSEMFPLYFFDEISIGWSLKWILKDYQDESDIHMPSVGQISSIGINGFKNYTGELYGQIRIIPELQQYPDVYHLYVYSGIFGFAGLHIGNQLIGSCLLIDIGPSLPIQ